MVKYDNQAKSAGYYGWPYVITDTKVFNDLTGKPFNPKALKNLSKNNTGIVDLPEPREPLHFYNRSCSIIGGVFHASADNAPTANAACVVSVTNDEGSIYVCESNNVTTTIQIQ